MVHAKTNTPSDGLSPSEIADNYCAGDIFARRLLQAGSELVMLPQGQALFRQGDPADSTYLLLNGRLAVRLEHENGTETQIAELGPGAPVGEMALLTGQPRAASVYAMTDAELARCSRANYERLAREHPDELAGFTRTVMHRLQEIQLSTVLADLFGIQDTELLTWLRGELEWICLDHGDVLFREGDPGEAMYILLSGRLRVTVSSSDHGQRVVGEVSTGEIVGELGLLSGEPRSASAHAIRETHLARMTLPVFLRLAERHPEATMRLARLIIQRQQRSLDSRQPKPVRALTLALVPASGDVSLLSFADELARCLELHGPVLALDSARLDSALGKPGAAQAESNHPTGLIVSAWLSQQESRLRYLLYVADPDWSPWTERCVRQADRLVLLGDAQAGPEPGLVEQAINGRNLSVRQELVLLHPSGARQPSGTARWLAERNLHTYHHVRLGDQALFRRLARRLAGQALGLVLSGGGARGLAHAGVLRAMEEREIEIDLIGGTSMGSLVGGLYAMDRRSDELVELAKRLANPKQIFDYTLPLTSLMASRKVTALIRDLYGDIQIEDLWRPFFCVASNLSCAEIVIDRSGPLWEAVRTSIAIPGVFSPMLRDSDVLVDGGLMNNFPVDIMVELCEGGPVVGSTVSPIWESRRRYDFGTSISGWRVLRSRVNPSRAMKVPSLLGSLMRSLEVNSVYSHRYAESLADVVIRPDVSAFSHMDYAAYEPMIEIGYQAAHERLNGWPAAQ